MLTVIEAENRSKPFRQFNPNKKVTPAIAANVNDDDAEISMIKKYQ